MADKSWLITADLIDSPMRAKAVARQSKNDSSGKTITHGIVGFLCGLLAGGVLYFIMWFFYSIDELLALYIMGPITFLLAIGMAFSFHCRCVVFLMVPNISTGEGRAAILSLIFAVMLIGPINNISQNATEVSRSMGCSANVARNQTDTLKQQLQDPINQIKNKTERMAATLQDINDKLKSAFEPIESALKGFLQGIEDIAGALDQASTACKNMFSSAYTDCYSGINSAYDDCKNALQNFRKRRDISEAQKLQFEEAIVKKIWNILYERKQNILRWRAEKLREEFMTASKKGYDQFFNMSELDDLLRDYDYINDVADLHPLRRKRGISDICEILNVATICDVFKVSNVLCAPVSSTDDAIVATAKAIKDLYDEVVSFFLFEIMKTFQVLGITDAEQLAKNLISEIESELSVNTSMVLTGFTYIGNLLALSILLLFIKSFNYMRHYLSQDEYDNIYITKQFKEYDEECESRGEPTVLPLKKPERKFYVDTRWIRMNSAEAISCLTGLIQLILHMLICMIVIFFDYVFYYIVNLVQRYGNVDIVVQGSSTVVFLITGDGIVAQFLKSLVEGINIHSRFDTDFNITQCLPNAHHPDTTEIPMFLGMYLLVLIFILLQAYAMRLRHKIMGFFYPMHELERIIFLHRKIIHKRKKHNAFLHQHVKSMKKAKEFKEDTSIGKAIATHIPALKSTVEGKTVCLSCKEVQHKHEAFYKCPNHWCEAIYCQQCYKDMNETCILCKNAQAMNEAIEVQEII